MSITEPALQTIPREKGEVRGAFISRESHKLIFADYEAQELRVLAHFMSQIGDNSMADIFALGELDLHRESASAIYGVLYEDVTKEQRRIAKNVNFAIVYGAGARKVASMIGVDEDTGRVMLNRLYKRFPGIMAFKRRSEKAMKQRGYVVTPYGRRHREKEERYAYKSVNSLVQGTAADITKAAAIKIDDRFKIERMHSLIVLLVHDETVVEAPVEEVETAVKIMTESMEDMPEICVPMKVKVSIADRWSEA